MGASRPDQLQHMFAERANAANLDGLLELYERGATFAGPDGVPACGTDAIRESLRSLLDGSPHITPLASHMLLAGDLALISNRWRISFGGALAGASFEGASTEVTRRQADGSWLYAIDSPSGAVDPA
jgi:ketosteroid isomerase-like protein